jgi:aminoglycoside phosphotransferase (APT) family kinase protein
VDWGELAIGDPAIDVGWSRMVLATEVSPQLGDNFIKTYSRHISECLKTLAFWEVFAACKRLTVLAGHRNPNVPLKPGLEDQVHDFMCQRLTGDED